MNCEDCGKEIPLDSEDSLIDWLHEQKEKRIMDEMVLGSSFMCTGCGGHLPADEVISTQ